jgi:hypothetical protein
MQKINFIYTYAYLTEDWNDKYLNNCIDEIYFMRFILLSNENPVQRAAFVNTSSSFT